MKTEQFEEFFKSYICTALWSTNDFDDDGNALDETYDITDIDTTTLAQLRIEAWFFFRDNYDDIVAEKTENNISHAGHDFWLTRNGHGAGFWDGDWPLSGDKLDTACEQYPEIDLYVGDDGAIYK